jgi:hypothetical protein
MIAMQSGIVAADIHDFTFSPSQEQQTSLDTHQGQHHQLAQQSHTHAKQSGIDCSHCVHSHCAHFVCLNNTSGLSLADYRDSIYYPYFQTTVTGFPASMFRPPRI